MKIARSVIKADIGSWRCTPAGSPSRLTASRIPSGIRCARAADEAMEIRRPGLFGAAMLPMSELEYTGITEKLAVLEVRFTLRSGTCAERVAA
jgi:fructose 1,6-bisphosphatase